MDQFLLSALEFLLKEYAAGRHPQDRDAATAQAHLAELQEHRAQLRRMRGSELEIALAPPFSAAPPSAGLADAELVLPDAPERMHPAAEKVSRDLADELTPFGL